MADGSVRPISGAIAPEIWNMILHPSGR
jgi:hypothetical protein